MTLAVLFYVLFIIYDHWIADFCLQTEDMATKKSTSIYWLSQHVKAYSLAMIPSAVVVGYACSNLYAGILWWMFNTIAHWPTDYCTSRWTSRLYAAKIFYSPNKYLKFLNFPAFFSVIGFDQTIHYACLFGSFCGLYYLCL